MKQRTAIHLLHPPTNYPLHIHWKCLIPRIVNLKIVWCFPEDNDQTKETMISTCYSLYFKKKMQTYTKYAISSCSQRKLTCPTLLINPEDPAERWVLVVRKPLDLKFLCRRHRSAEALDSQYGKVRFSSPTWNNFDTKVNKFLEASRRDEL